MSRKRPQEGHQGSAGSAHDEVTRRDQAAWEAPELRPVFTRFGEPEQWPHPCPDWCTGDGPDHEVAAIAARRTRRHRSESIRVRQDAAFGYDSFDGADDDGGVMAANLEVYLDATSRAAHYGKNERHATFKVAPMYPDEIRELICVLQHLLKVAQA